MEIKIQKKLDQSEKNKELMKSVKVYDTKARLAKWTERREKQTKSTMMQDRRRFNKSNQFFQEHTDLLT